MKKFVLPFLLVSLTWLPVLFAAESTATPLEKVDPVTGARIILLSKEPSPAAGVIYFTQPCTTLDSRYTLVRYLDKSAGHTAGHMYRYDFQTGELKKLTERMRC